MIWRELTDRWSSEFTMRDVINIADSGGLQDRFARRFQYLRLSLTDICNFSCSYCLPNGFRKQKDVPPQLSVDEHIRLVRAFAALGVWKIRLTGGEPTIRPEFLEIASLVSAIDGIKKLAVTTNGYRLPERAESYARAGITAINISTDSLKSEKFHKITKHDRLLEVLDGITACQDAGIETIKVNTVLLKGLNDDELADFIAFVKDRPIVLRFIELMRTNSNPDYFERHHLTGRKVTDLLEQSGWHQLPRAEGAGPAIEFAHKKSVGRIGLIAPYSPDFCSTCNRLRVSATGKLHLCLFGEGGFDLRPLLQSDAMQAELMERICRLMVHKEPAHDLHNGNSGATPHLASIGG